MLSAPPAGFYLEPSWQEAQVGGRAFVDALYDPDGPGGAPAQGVAWSSGWISLTPTIVSYNGSGSGFAEFAAIGQGSGMVQATYLGFVATAEIDTIPGQPDPLRVLLTPRPDIGDAPLVTDLEMEVSGTAQGTINYNLWWNCTYVGTSIPGAENQCGVLPSPNAGECLTNTNGMKCLAINETSKIQVHTYPSPGNYIATVIAERGGYADASGAFVSARQGLSHFECVSNACVSVSGAGPSRCGTSADCTLGTSGVCDSVARACVNDAGGAGTSCASDPACGGGGPSHLECQSNACVVVGGAGGNQSGCATVGAACGAVGPCTFVADPSTIRRGGSSTLAWTCGGGVTSCSVTQGGSPVTSGGGSGEVAVTPAQTSDYVLSCNGASS